MGAKQSSGGRPRSYSSEYSSDPAHNAAILRQLAAESASSSGPSHRDHRERGRPRANSIPVFVGPSLRHRLHHGQLDMSGPSSSTDEACHHTHALHQDDNHHRSGSPQDSDSSDDGPFRNFLQSTSLPQPGSLLLHGLKCPICSKFVPPDDIECHLVMCLTKPRLSYNTDVLTDDQGECVICLEELEQGHTIARLPCLCIYHKTCIDAWFQRNRSCPEHPGD